MQGGIGAAGRFTRAFRGALQGIVGELNPIGWRFHGASLLAMSKGVSPALSNSVKRLPMKAILVKCRAGGGGEAKSSGGLNKVISD